METTLTRPPHAYDSLRVISAGICALILTVGIARFAYTPLLPVMRHQAGLSDLAGGWLATFNYLGYMLGALAVAMIGNLTRKFQLYRLSLVLAVVSTMAMGLTDNMTLWAILRFLSGISSTGGLLLASGLVLNWLIRHGHAPSLGLHFTGMGVGIVVSGLAVTAMIDHLAWQGQWLGLGLLGAAFFVPAWRWLPAPAAKHAGAAHTAPPPSRRWMTLLISAYFCAGFGYVISATFIVAIVEKLPLMAGRGGWVWVVVGLAAMGSCFLWDRIARRTGQIPALLWAYGLQIVSVVLPAASGDVVLILLSAVLYGGTFVGIVSLTLSLVGRHFPANPAKAMARLTLSYGVAQIIAPVMAGYIATSSGSYHGALIVTAAIMAVGMLLLFALGRQHP
ncbi:YbfB/YjiJ family MFS transporter [Paludibacterium sp.]|uniref:YbfB/YjiJ family MFS transporter n=3 Tax=Paludibacterium sp. TaxID=1917523 RepID=UPI0025D2C599|nr:YbfB/YjiJ family MFS transporter [Paludibacterium sp.]MBV8647343.1 YbfB/YjiJ family MFS transporter [Paludibacterium sp.]